MNPVTMYGFNWQNRHFSNDSNSFLSSTPYSAYSGSQPSSVSTFAPSNTFNIRNPNFTNDIEMEEITDEEPMDFEITPPPESQHTAAVAQQVAQDEMLARMLQAQYYAEARISFRRTSGRVQLNLHSSRQLQNSQLQRLQEDLQSISLLLRTWTPFIVQERYEDVVDIFFELGHRSRGLKRSQINALPTRQFSSSVSSETNCDESSTKDCSICLSEYINGDMLRILPCFHKFHVTCIDKWLKSHNNCPLCRNEIPRQ